MTVSTATAAWNNGTLVGASGTFTEVLAELANATSSNATLENRGFLMSWGVYFGTGASEASAGVLWYNTKTKADWS